MHVLCSNRQASHRLVLLTALWFVLALSSQAGAVGLDEMGKARRWVAAKLEGVSEQREPESTLVVLANHGSVQKNGRGGKAMKIVDVQFTRGLYCHAPSKIVVRLPSPGRSFSATVGVDSNDQTRPGKGSVVFSVSVADKEAFRSTVIREGMPSSKVDVDLQGAKEFVLEIGEAGDGIACDQADWADARVVLADGKTMWLDEMPVG